MKFVFYNDSINTCWFIICTRAWACACVYEGSSMFNIYFK